MNDTRRVRTAPEQERAVFAGSCMGFLLGALATAVLVILATHLSIGWTW